MFDRINYIFKGQIRYDRNSKMNTFQVKDFEKLKTHGNQRKILPSICFVKDISTAINRIS